MSGKCNELYPSVVAGETLPELTPADKSAVRGMHRHAAGVATFLDQYWSDSERQSTTLERVALWHAVRLDLACERFLGIDESGVLVERLLGPASPSQRYNTLAAVLTIPRLVPFRSDVERLRRITDVEAEDWGEHVAMEEQQVVATWHEWLSPEHLKVSIPPYDDHGAASVFAVASERLADNLLQSLALHCDS
jgi:hypothetical protein